MNYAIDREEMNQVLHDGEYLICQSVLYPFTAYYYYNDIIKYNYDLYASFEWLDAAGYPTGELPPTTTGGTTEDTPFPVFALIAAIGAAASIAFYRRRK